MFIEQLGWIGVKAKDANAINGLLHQLNLKAPERTSANLVSLLNRINQNGGVAVTRENGGRIVAMGTWAVVPTLMRVEVLARNVIADQSHPEWLRFLRELVQYLINRAKAARAERIYLTWNPNRPGREIFFDLGFEEVDTRLLRLIF